MNPKQKIDQQVDHLMRFCLDAESQAYRFPDKEDIRWKIAKEVHTVATRIHDMMGNNQRKVDLLTSLAEIRNMSLVTITAYNEGTVKYED